MWVMVQSIYVVFPLSWRVLATARLLDSLCALINAFLWLLFCNLFQNTDYFWPKKADLWTFFVVFANFYVALLNLQVFVWDFLEEKQVLKISQKAKNWYYWNKCLVYFELKKNNYVSNFWYYLDDEDLNYQLSTKKK